jgi:tRNA modification GTPase
MNNFLDDTIAALATAPGKGAIAIVRMSGSKSIEILNCVFAGSKKLYELASGHVLLGRIVFSDNTNVVDKVLVSIFRTPHSFTGEDVVEISCHGGTLVVKEIIGLLLENGARMAHPGEFTQRAFLNGKMDLLQAESVADVIDSQTRYSLMQSQNQLSGKLSERLMHFKARMTKQLALLEIELDFSEDDIEFASRDELLGNIDELLSEIDTLLDTFVYGKVLREGVHLALVGRPNVGKSSILNRLIEEDRAIVSDIPGTTRDVIEEAFDIDGLLFNISDTAGLRITKDEIEKQGVARTKDILSKADLILFIIEAGEKFTREDIEASKIINDAAEGTLVFLLINKTDLQPNQIKVKKDQIFRERIELSAKTGEGFLVLKQKISKKFLSEDTNFDFAFINKARHQDALRRAKKSLVHAKMSLQNDLSSEYISLDVRNAIDALGEITGEVTTDDILSEIFSSFCIGK